MALVSGGRSTLNPNAPLFVPAAFRQVEDFSPEWWELVKTSKWFHDYWLHEHEEHENFAGNDDDEDIVDLLPESFDFGIGGEAFTDASMDPVQYAEPKEPAILSPKTGMETSAEAVIKNLSLKSPKGVARLGLEPAKYCEKPVQHVSPKSTSRRIQQPR